jgi:hypothetical protein
MCLSARNRSSIEVVNNACSPVVVMAMKVILAKTPPKLSEI